LNEWVKKSHPARVFSDIVDQIDISAFQEIKLEGRPRFDTLMMLKVFLLGYANGVRARLTDSIDILVTNQFLAPVVRVFHWHNRISLRKY
jgi:hypothetical protein